MGPDVSAGRSLRVSRVGDGSGGLVVQPVEHPRAVEDHYLWKHYHLGPAEIAMR
jgi:hypothetical protein